MAQQTQRPARRFKAGSVYASVWETTRERDGRTTTRYSVTICKRYRDKEGAWRNSTSFFPNDLPRVQYVAGKAFDYVNSQGSRAG